MAPCLEPSFQCLFDESAGGGRSLPDDVQAIYGGDWRLPESSSGVYTYSNFVVSHDGRISFNEPGHYGGGDVSGGNRHDRWLMALLRARSDAVMVGDNTLSLEPEHLWTHEFIFPASNELFRRLRNSEKRSQYPLQVFLSLAGEINWDAAVFQDEQMHVVVATTRAGADRIEQTKRARARLDVIVQDHDVVNLRELEQELGGRYRISSLLVEGGPRAYGSAVSDRIIDEEFLTLSPIIVGNDHGNDRHRPGLFEGLAYSPDNAARMKPLSLRRSGDYLFLRSHAVYPDDNK